MGMLLALQGKMKKRLAISLNRLWTLADWASDLDVVTKVLLASGGFSQSCLNAVICFAIFILNLSKGVCFSFFFQYGYLSTESVLLTVGIRCAELNRRLHGFWGGQNPYQHRWLVQEHADCCQVTLWCSSSQRCSSSHQKLTKTMTWPDVISF